MEGTPHHIQTEAGLAFESDSLHRGHLPGSDPVHEVPGPPSLLGDLGDAVIEEFLFRAFGCPVKGNPIVLSVHLQGNVLGASTVFRPLGFRAHTHPTSLSDQGPCRCHCIHHAENHCGDLTVILGDRQGGETISDQAQELGLFIRPRFDPLGTRL